MHKSWKPARRDERSFYRLVGDFVSEDHLFVSLVKAHSFVCRCRRHNSGLVIEKR
jgi:hypothetical protein